MEKFSYICINKWRETIQKVGFLIFIHGVGKTPK